MVWWSSVECSFDPMKKSFVDQMLNVCLINVKSCVDQVVFFDQMIKVVWSNVKLNVALINVRWCFDLLLNVVGQMLNVCLNEICQTDITSCETLKCQSACSAQKPHRSTETCACVFVFIFVQNNWAPTWCLRLPEKNPRQCLRDAWVILMSEESFHCCCA